MSGYDDIAGWYHEAIREGTLAPFHGWIVPIVVDLAGDVEGCGVYDLDCGRGVAARSLADRGARVLGVDTSEKQLGIARLYEHKEGQVPLMDL